LADPTHVQTLQALVRVCQDRSMHLPGGMVVGLAILSASCASSSQPRSCNAAAWSMVADGATRTPEGKGPSQQTLLWQRRCELDQRVAAYNAQLELERRRYFDEQRREQERAARRHQLEVRRLELEAERTRLAASSPPAAAAPAAADQRMLIFGGRNHDVFLGCICPETDRDSVLNEYGPHGGRYSTTSIWYRYGDYGSLYGSYSACSPYATEPPVVVLADGTFIGRLTVNKHARGAITDERVVEWLEKSVCTDP
jgi:hypothetical protein